MKLTGEDNVQKIVQNRDLSVRDTSMTYAMPTDIARAEIELYYSQKA